MSNNAEATVVAGTGQVYVAPVGTALPTGPETALNGAFESLGYTSEDGVGYNWAQELFRLRALQKRADIRRERTSTAFSVTAQLLQWDRITMPFAFSGGEITSVTGGYKFTPPGADDALDERALVVDIEDGEEVLRIVIPKGNVIEGVSGNFARSSASTLATTFEALEEDEEDLWYFLSNSDAFAEGS